MFSRVAETRALAAQAGRVRASRGRTVPGLSRAGSTTSVGSPALVRSTALTVVSFNINFFCSLFSAELEPGEIRKNPFREVRLTQNPRILVKNQYKSKFDKKK